MGDRVTIYDGPSLPGGNGFSARLPFRFNFSYPQSSIFLSDVYWWLQSLKVFWVRVLKNPGPTLRMIRIRRLSRRKGQIATSKVIMLNSTFI